MEIIPAIDLRNGKCVRLYQGDYQRETIFSDKPVEVALRWQSEGARRLHLIDLDGAAKGELCNLEAIEDIIAAIDIPVQVGGGITPAIQGDHWPEFGSPLHPFQPLGAHALPFHVVPDGQLLFGALATAPPCCTHVLPD